MDDLVAAIATAPGEGSIGIIRVSGPGAVETVDGIFESVRGAELKEMPSFQMAYGYIVGAPREVEAQRERLDEVLVSVMRGPHSFTGEDVVEINCHGGMVPLRKVLEAVLQSGARLAEPGEFSKRAFLNGRIDLSQAESIIDVIRSRTDQGLKVALHQLEGGLSEELDAVKQKLIEVLAFIEAGIDFPEDDVEEISREKISALTTQAAEKVGKLIGSAETGRIYREGLSAVIVGKPNVGKSSLLNALLREKRAIVTEVPGTTRDVIEEVLNLRGIPVRLIDTAGIRETEDIVEKIGVEKTLEWFGMADLVLVVLDAKSGIEEEDRELAGLIKGQRCLVIINKIDVENSQISRADLPEELKDFPLVEISVREKFGLEELEDKLAGLVLSGKVRPGEQAVISNLRHKSALEKAAKQLDGVLYTLKLGLPTDCMAIDLKGALESIGEITGESVGEDIIHKIFAQFCLGK